MPALAFGFNKASKAGSGPPKLPPKRKAAFADLEDDAQDDDNDAFGALAKPKAKPRAQLKPLDEGSGRPPKSPKLTESSNGKAPKESSQYSNLSALRSAKLHDTEASKLDASVYDYDEIYDAFTADRNKPSSKTNSEPEVPKYMTNLMASAEVRKRDQLRAKERALQKEREQEGEAFADKEAFVTGAYKKQQEEMRKVEEEERQRAETEEEKRRKGGGMTAFHKDVLRRDEERAKAIEEAAREARERKKKKVENGDADVDVDRDPGQKTDTKVAEEMNEKGAHVVVNDEGDIVDKRQLLSAGLNVAPKKPGNEKAEKKASTTRPQETQRSGKQQDARTAQRERQSRMMEQQIAEIEAKQREADVAKQREREDKNQSKLTETDKMSAKERYLQRKKEREEEAKKAKAGTG